MAHCINCPYKYKSHRKFGTVYRCLIESTEMNITYYTREKHKDEEMILCTFNCEDTRISGVDYEELADYGRNGEWRPPCISAQNAWNILSHHILGKDYYIVDPVRNEQGNAIELLDIIEKLHRRI